MLFELSDLEKKPKDELLFISIWLDKGLELTCEELLKLEEGLAVYRQAFRLACEKCLQQHKTISDLQYKLDIAEKALDKMSEYAINDNDLYDLVSDFNIENERYDEDHFGIDTCDVVDYFKERAEKNLKRENTKNE